MKKKSRRRVGGLHGIPGLGKKGGYYFYWPPQVDGVRPKRIYLRTADPKEAVKLVEDIINKGIERRDAEPIAELANTYLAAKLESGEHRPTTNRATKTHLSRFVSRFSKKADLISADDILNWRSEMLAADLSKASVKTYMTAAGALMTWAHDTGRITVNPFAKLPKKAIPQNVPTRRERFCSKALRDQLIDECQDEDLKAVLFLGFHAGLRRGEILALRPHWVIMGEDGTQPFTVKDAEIRNVPISRPLGEFLRKFLPGRTPYVIRPDVAPGKFIYRWEWKRQWATYMKKHGCPWVTAHTMRHTFVTLLLSAKPENRPSLLHLERWTGTNTETLKKSYAHLIEDQDLINAAN